MKNYEKYENEIRKYNGNEFCVDFVQPYILKENGCASINCEACFMYQMVWLLKDYEEIKEPEKPEVDWSKVEVDTPILVKAVDNSKWKKRYFAQYKDGIVYAWDGGKTSWNKDCMTSWKYAKLVEDQKEPEIDWSKVEVDTVILVKTHKAGEWFKRHFAEYKNGKVYTWDNGHTSNETSCMTTWKYAKLIED